MLVDWLDCRVFLYPNSHFHCVVTFVVPDICLVASTSSHSPPKHRKNKFIGHSYPRTCSDLSGFKTVTLGLGPGAARKALAKPSRAEPGAAGACRRLSGTNYGVIVTQVFPSTGCT